MIGSASRTVSIISGSVLAVALLLSGGSAQARDRDGDGRDDGSRRLTIAVDLDYAKAVTGDFVENGGGGALRIGSELDLFLVSLIPEVLLDYHSFGTNGRKDMSILSGKVGGRIRFLKILEPGIFAHIGVGHLSDVDPYNSHTGAAFDAGVTLDLTILPLIDLGLHASWNRLFGGYDSGLSYAIAGAHVALVL